MAEQKTGFIQGSGGGGRAREFFPGWSAIGGIMWPDLGESSGIGGIFFLFCRTGPDHSSTSGQGQLRTTIREVWGAGLGHWSSSGQGLAAHPPQGVRPGHHSRLGVEPGGQRSPGAGFTAGV